MTGTQCFADAPLMPPALEILKPGLFTTVQDLGRRGFQKYGVSVSGAMDLFSHRVANRLLGNPDEAATLECTLLGPRIRFLADLTIAVAGADLSPRIDGSPIPEWESVRVRKGSVLDFQACRSGCRAYLAVEGGLEVSPVLGSRATHVRTRLGGLEGRAIKSGDILSSVGRPVWPPYIEKHQIFRSALPGEILRSRKLRFVLGPQEDFFTLESIQDFLQGKFRVSPHSDRMGIRLEGKPLVHRAGADIVSDAVPFGSIQVPADGQPIVLAADRQTTGGYPKIGVVATVDFTVLAQLKPGDEIQFVRVDLDSALEALKALEMELESGLVISQ